MTKAVDALKTWDPTEAKASSKWRDQFASNFKNKVYRQSNWERDVATAKTELAAELKTSSADVAAYGKRMSDLHDDVKSRMANIMTMVKALGDSGPETPRLAIQAKSYCQELITDLGNPVDRILKRCATALQGNRLNLMLDSDIDNGLKINKHVPVDDLKKLLKEFKLSRKALIDDLSETTRAHTDKVKTFRERAQDALTMIDKLERVATTARSKTKDDLNQQIKDCAAFFSSNDDCNFLKPTSQLVDLRNLAKQVAGKDKKTVSDALVKVGGKDRVGAYLTLVSKKYNEWKIREKEIDLLDVYCKKVKNDTANASMAKVRKLADANKKAGQEFKAQAELIAKAWVDTAALRA